PSRGRYFRRALFQLTMDNGQGTMDSGSVRTDVNLSHPWELWKRKPACHPATCPPGGDGKREVDRDCRVDPMNPISEREAGDTIFQLSLIHRQLSINVYCL